MAESAAHLVDHVLPDVPVRQWVVTFPWHLRYLFARNPALLRAVRRSVLRLLLAATRKRSGFAPRRSANTGAICAVQRFGSALNLNVHFHALLLDGAYTSSAAGPPTFHRAPPPTNNEVEHLLLRIRTRVLHILRSTGYLEPATSDAPPTQLELITAAAIQGRSALGAEQEALSLIHI